MTRNPYGRKGKQITYEGKVYTQSALAKHLGIQPSTLKRRMEANPQNPERWS